MFRFISGISLLSVSIFFVSTATWLHFTFLERSIFTDHRIVKFFNVNPILFKQWMFETAKFGSKSAISGRNLIFPTGNYISGPGKVPTGNIRAICPEISGQYPGKFPGNYARNISGHNCPEIFRANCPEIFRAIARIFPGILPGYFRA